MVCQSHAGSGCLGIVDQNVDISKGVDSFLYHTLHNRLIVTSGTYICLHRQNLDSIEPFQLFLGIQ